MSFDLIIFDCDGVLVDSEVISCRVVSEVMTRHGYPVSAGQVFDRFLGRSVRQAMVEVETELGRPLPAEFQPELQRVVRKTFAESLEPIPHIHDALAAITQKICVASSGSHERMEISLGRCKLTERFAPHIFSAMDVTHGKPAPDLFLHAAAKMGVAPGRCVVIEDSVSGVTAGVAAGMTVFGFAGGSHCRPGHGDTLNAAGAALTFSDMRELPGLVGLEPSFRGVSPDVAIAMSGAKRARNP